MTIVDVNVNVETVEQVTVLATKVDVLGTAQNYTDEKLTFFLDFGVEESGSFVSKRQALLTVTGGVVFAQLLATVVPGVNSLLLVEWPDVVSALITTLNDNPSLVDGVDVILEYLPLTITT